MWQLVHNTADSVIGEKSLAYSLLAASLVLLRFLRDRLLQFFGICTKYILQKNVFLISAKDSLLVYLHVESVLGSSVNFN